MNNELNSIEDIDAMLDSQYSVDEEQGTDIEEVQEDTVEEETEVENQEIEEETDEEADSVNDDEGSEEPKSDEKPSKEDKKAYAFSQLRKENADLKSKVDEKQYYEDLLNKMAAQYGYSDVKKFAEDYEKARIEQEAKAKGYDPVLYAELQKSNKRIAELENSQKETELINKANIFRASVDKAVEEYNLGKDGRNEIFTRLEEAGFSVDDLLNVPNADILIKGVLSDKIAQVSKQSQIEKNETIDSLSDDKHNGGSSEKTFSLDDLISGEMKQYKADNFYE